jgi:hypothetical protein
MSDDFIASEAVKPLNYDFSPYSKAKGTVPEPSQADIKKFQKKVRSVSPDGSPKKLSQLSDEEAEAAHETLVTALAEFCHGKPTQAQIETLPYRVLVAFIGWLFGSFSNPTQQTSDTKS